MRVPDDKKRFALEVKEKLVRVCTECGGTGYRESIEGMVERCDCMLIYRYLKELILAGIPYDYWHLTLAGLDVAIDYRESVGLFLENIHKAVAKGMGMVFLGPNGTGKTSLMCEIGKEAIVNGIPTRYFTLSHYIDSIQKNDSDAQEYMREGRVLLIDELDKKYIKSGSNFVVKAVDEALRDFLNNNKSVILCTNWNVTELSDILGESAVSLLRRRCEFMVIAGTDYSSNLSASFWERLKGDVDYYAEAIIENALRLEAFSGEVASEW